MTGHEGHREYRRTKKKQESDQTVLTKALTETTKCTGRAKNLNNFLYKNTSGTLVAVG